MTESREIVHPHAWPARHVSRRGLLRSAFVGGSGLVAFHILGCDDGGGQPSLTSTPTLANPTAPLQPTPTPAVLRWQQLSPAGPLPPARRDHSLVDGELPDPHLVLFGGRNGPGDLADLWTFDLAAGSWAEVQASPAPPPRHGHNAVWDGSRAGLVVFGGQQGNAFLNDVWTVEPARANWAELPLRGGTPAPRYGAGGASGDGRMLITHGFTDSGRFDDTWGFNLLDREWEDRSPTGQRPVERCLMRAAWDSRNERLLMFGGQTTDTPYLGDLWAFEEGGWRQIVGVPSPAPRNFYSFVFDDEAGRAILFGGRTAGGPGNDLWYFDTMSETWEQKRVEGDGPSARFGHDAAWHPETRSLLVFGGNDGGSDLNDLWELSVPL